MSLADATPESFKSRRISITAAQKQALIDNLQLEVTERARKLRSQYALQAQSLRTRIELRINRIPTALRKVNMGELLDKYSNMSQAADSTGLRKSLDPSKGGTRPEIDSNGLQPVKAHPEMPTESRGMKRTSEIFSQTGDKENDYDQAGPNQKKRLKPNTTRNVPNPSTVLSPKSGNSRNLPQSPIRPTLGSPQKSQLSRLQSPLKANASPRKSSANCQSSTGITAAMNGNLAKGRTRRPKAEVNAGNSPPRKGTGATRAKRGPAVAASKRTNQPVRTVSAASTASTDTTIVRPSGRGRASKNAGMKAAEKKAAAVAVEPPKSGRRVLRKR